MTTEQEEVEVKLPTCDCCGILVGSEYIEKRLLSTDCRCVHITEHGNVSHAYVVRLKLCGACSGVYQQRGVLSLGEHVHGSMVLQRYDPVIAQQWLQSFKPGLISWIETVGGTVQHMREEAAREKRKKKAAEGAGILSGIDNQL